MSHQSSKRTLSEEDCAEEFGPSSYEDDQENLMADEATPYDAPQGAGSVAHPPDRPHWVDGNLIVPPFWKGEHSGIGFRVQFGPEGAVLNAEIPGENGALLSALCLSGEGLLEIASGIDAAIAIASNPEQASREFLYDNALRLQLAIAMIHASANSIEHAMDHVFRPPDRAQEYDTQNDINTKGAAALRKAVDRIEQSMSRHLDPAFLHATRSPSPSFRQH